MEQALIIGRAVGHPPRFGYLSIAKKHIISTHGIWEKKHIMSTSEKKSLQVMKQNWKKLTVSRLSLVFLNPLDPMWRPSLRALRALRPHAGLLPLGGAGELGICTEIMPMYADISTMMLIHIYTYICIYIYRQYINCICIYIYIYIHIFKIHTY